VRRVNDVGLQRAGFSEQDIESLHAAFRMIYRSGNPRQRTLENLRAQAPSEVVLELVQSLENTGLGQKGRYRESLRAELARQGARRILGEVHA
jgi:UDP-N-acetylglucosamine acyltransferase